MAPPLIDVQVPASSEPSRVIAWVCTICGTSSVHVDTTGSAVVSIELFDTIGWAALPSGKEFVCDGCRKLPDVAHALLAQGGAHTQ